MKVETKPQPENVCKPFYISLPLIISYKDTTEEWSSNLSLTNNRIPHYKPPRIGVSFQAVIPDWEDDSSGTQTSHELIWDPTKLKDEQVKSFLKKAKVIFKSKCKDTNVWTDRHKEYCMTKLHDFKYDVSACLLHLEENVDQMKTPADCWNTIEATLFDSCYQPHIYHKDWHRMQAVIRTKSVSEIVDYYYWWKRKKDFSNYNVQDSKAAKQELMEQMVEDRDIPRLRRRERLHTGTLSENKKRTLNNVMDDGQLPLYYDISVTAGIDWDKVRQLEVKKRRLESPEHMQLGFPVTMYNSHSHNLHLNIDAPNATTPTHETHEHDFPTENADEKENNENDIDFQSWFSVNE